MPAIQASTTDYNTIKQILTKYKQSNINYPHNKVFLIYFNKYDYILPSYYHTFASNSIQPLCHNSYFNPPN